MRGSIQLDWIVAKPPFEKVRLMLVTSSMPGDTWALPWQFTAIGFFPMMNRMIEMSCGARSHATLMSFWNSPRFSRRQLMFMISPISPESTISLILRTVVVYTKVWPTISVRPRDSASSII